MQNTKLKSEERTRIMLVDDDFSLLEMSKLVLTEMEDSLSFDFASGVNEALTKLSKEQYDVVISDYEMPLKNGLDFLKELKEKGIAIPFILFTGKGREEVAIQALNLGADHYVNKQGSTETVYGELLHGIRQSVQRKKAEKALRTSEENFRAYLESSPVSVFVANKDGKYQYVNSAAIRLLGFSKEEILDMFVFQVVPKEDTPGRRFNQLKEKGYFAEEMKIKRKDDSLVEVFLSATKLPDGKLIAFCQEITEYKQSQERLKQTSDLLENVGEGIDVGLAVINKEYKIVWANKRLINAGFSADKRCYQTFNKLNQVCPDCGVKKIFEQNLPIDVHEFKFVNSQDETTWVEIRVTPLKNKYGETMAALELAVPITERKKAEDALKESEEKYQTAFKASTDALLIHDGQRSIDCNPSAIKLFGFDSFEEFQSKRPDELSPERQPNGKSSLEEVKKHHQKAMKNGVDHFIWLHQKKDKTLFPADVLLTKLTISGREVIQATIRDITEQKRMEHALHESESKYRNMFNNAEVGMFRTKFDGSEIIDFNEKYLEIFGFTAIEMQGQASTSFWADPLERQAMINTLQEKGFVKDFECKMKTKNGKIKLCLTSVKHYPEQQLLEGSIIDITTLRQSEVELSQKCKILENLSEALESSEKRFKDLADTLPEIVFETDLQGKLTYVNKKALELTGYTQQDFLKGAYNFQFFAPENLEVAKKNFTEALRASKPTNNEYTLLKSDGTKFPAIIKGIPIMSGNKTIGMRGIIVDLTERKNAEKKLSNINEKLRVIGNLTRHDVGNKLTTVNTNAYLLKKKLNGSPDLLRHVEAIEQAVNQSAKILEFSKLYERVGVEELSEINVEACFEQAVKLIGNQNLEIINKTKGLVVIADTMLSQLFYNLIDNSLRHGQRVTKIFLRYQQNEDFTKLIYEDNGIGISPENKAKIFSKGFTTGGGTGLGLSLVKKQVEVYGWTIAENGKEGKGARFEITIPNPSVSVENNPKSQ